MAAEALFKKYNLAPELQYKIFSFAKDNKESYDNVMKELTLNYNQGLWWLSKPRAHWGPYTEFQDYLDDQVVYVQAILHEHMLNELLSGFWDSSAYGNSSGDFNGNSDDEWGPTQEEMEHDEQENYDHYYDPFSSDALYD